MRPTSTLFAAVLLGLAPAAAVAQTPTPQAPPSRSAPAAAGAETPLQRAAALQLLSSGTRWAEIEGKLQPDGTFLANDVEIIAAEDKENMQDMEITGVASDVDPAKSSLQVLGYTVRWNDTTKITDAQKQRIQAASLQNGKDIRATGSMQPDGTFLARKLRLRQPSVENGVTKHKEEIVGPVKVVDPGKGTLRVSKTTVQLKSDCEFVALPVEAQEGRRSEAGR